MSHLYSKEEIQKLMDEVFAALMEEQKRPEPFQPAPIQHAGATEEELQALETHWGKLLPPSYKYALTMCNGIQNYYYPSADLLSTGDIINNTKGVESFQEFYPRLFKHIFVCGTEGYDGFAFDAEKVDENGEWGVVGMSADGEDPILDSFGDFLVWYRDTLQAGLKEEV